MTSFWSGCMLLIEDFKNTKAYQNVRGEGWGGGNRWLGHAFFTKKIYPIRCIVSFWCGDNILLKVDLKNTKTYQTILGLQVVRLLLLLILGSSLGSSVIGSS